MSTDADGAHKPLIFLHVPKTAGISVRTQILGLYGQDEVFLDYGGSPFFPGASIQTFDFVGEFSRLHQDMSKLYGELGLPPPDAVVENANADPAYRAGKAGFLQDAASMARCRDLLHAEIGFYERHGNL